MSKYQINFTTSLSNLSWPHDCNFKLSIIPIVETHCWAIKEFTAKSECLSCFLHVLRRQARLVWRASLDRKASLLYDPVKHSVTHGLLLGHISKCTFETIRVTFHCLWCLPQCWSGEDGHYHCVGCDATAARSRKSSRYQRFCAQDETTPTTHGADRGNSSLLIT